jgi:AraC-like DNA-binding protein
MSIATLPDRASVQAQSQFSKFCEPIQARLGADEVILLTTMPRGGLQICRRMQLQEGLMRRYVTEMHTHDSVAWRAIRDGVVAGADVKQGEDTPIAHGLATVLAVRIESPVFAGYPGVVMVLRKQSNRAPAFDADVEAAEVRRLFHAHLESHPPADAQPRQFVFDAAGDVLIPRDGVVGIDAQLADGIRELVRSKAADGRHALADSRGVRTAVEVVRFEHYSALSTQPVVFVSMHPTIADWSHLTPEAFEADAELSRLSRAVTFMVLHYQEGPTLESIADSVELSQFHFHRRFSELFGVTPKHLLYDLQLNEAKRLLSDPKQQLASIARHCGFAHQSHFTSRFKQGVGITPTRWRRQVLQIDA